MDERTAFTQRSVRSERPPRSSPTPDVYFVAAAVHRRLVDANDLVIRQHSRTAHVAPRLCDRFFADYFDGARPRAASSATPSCQRTLPDSPDARIIASPGSSSGVRDEVAATVRPARSVSETVSIFSGNGSGPTCGRGWRAATMAAADARDARPTRGASRAKPLSPRIASRGPRASARRHRTSP